MKLYYESVNIEEWNFFENIKGVGDVNNFFYIKGMNKEDKVIIHISKSKNNDINGVYAWGTIVGNAEIEQNPANFCYGKKAVNVRIECFSKDTPLLTHEVCKEYIKNFRSTHKLSEEAKNKIVELLGIQ